MNSRLDEQFVAAARAFPDRAALIWSGRPVTYRELDLASERLARHLNARGVGPETLVGVCLDRGPGLLAALLGVLRAGGAYVPIDPGHPRERRDYIIRDAGLALLIASQDAGRPAALPLLPVDAATGAIAPGEPPVPEPPVLEPTGRVRPGPPGPANAAYAIYTSGSTGNPKGVVITHAALTNFLLSMRLRPGIGSSSTLVAITTVGFDIAALELFLPLTTGGRVVLATTSDARDPGRIADLISSHGADAMQATPATWRMLRVSGWAPPPGFTVMCGGEKLPDLAGWLGRTAGEAWDLYGPTETTIWSSVARIGADGALTSWQPVRDTAFQLLDSAMRPSRDGESGEVYIGGTGLARCYLGRPGLTAGRFVPSPSGPPGARLYRTGDVGRRRDGVLEILGRTDHQVKVRGHRIELGEIEAVATASPAVRYCVAQPFADLAAGTRLALFVVPEAGQAPAPAELRSLLAAKLPEYMLPYRYVLLDHLPLTPNGKVDREALRLPDEAPAPAEALGRQPATALEHDVVRAWAEVLGLPAFGPDDDVFAAGGHSLGAAAVAARLRDRLRTEISAGDLLRLSTPAAQAEFIARHRGEAARPVARPGRTSASGQPLTPAQRRMWLLEQVRSGSSPYATVMAYRLNGPVDTAAFATAVRLVAERHEILLARFPVEGGQAVQQTSRGGRIPVTFRAAGGPASESDVLSEVEARTRAHFDLAAGPPMRVAFWPLGPGRAIVLFHWHHIVFDGWSLGIYLSELATAYDEALNGRRPGWAPLPITYAAAQERQQNQLSDSLRTAQLDFWKRQLEGIPELSTWPADRTRPVIQSSDGAQVYAVIDAATAAELRHACASARVTFYVGLLALFGALAASYAGSEEAIIGTPVASRVRPEYEQLIGFFVNTLVLRWPVDRHETLAVLMARTSETVLDALAHQDVPFEEVVNALRPRRSLGHNPLFQVLFNFEGPETGSLRLRGVSAEPLPVHSGGSRFDLTLTVKAPGDGPLYLEAEYSTDLFAQSTIECAVRQYTEMIGAVARRGTRARVAELLAAGSHDRALLAQWNATGADFGGFGAELCVHDLVERQARLTPDAIALSSGARGFGARGFGAREVTYGQLVSSARRLARRLSALGAGRGQVVGVCLERGPGLAVALLAVLRSGAAYLPLDPSYPVRRLAASLSSARAVVVISAEGICPVLPADAPEVIFIEREDPGELPGKQPEPAGPDDDAYVIYTSGSTGAPKGVRVPHRLLVNLINWQNRDQLSGARTAQLSSAGFDVHFQEIFITLASGGTVIFAPEKARRDPSELLSWLSSARVEQLICTPTMLEQLARECRVSGAVPDSLREVTAAGEQLTMTADVRWVLDSSQIDLRNQFGPSETHCAAAFRCPRDDDSWITHPPIGRPIANRQIHVLDDQQRQLPVGVTGELYIAGIGRAGGYLGLAAMTAEKFVPDPFGGAPGARMYRTGDLGRWLPKGALEHRGRCDDQLKIRGVRVEPGEIEARLQRHPAVREAAVAVKELGKRNLAIIAYVVAAAGQPVPQAEELRRHLAQDIPGFAVPALYVPVDSLPRTASGKLHRSALPDPPMAATALRAPFVAPSTEVEIWVAAAWSRELGVTEVGVHDDFFTIGGNSLLGIRLIAEMNERFGASVNPRELFALPTVSGLAEAAQRSARDGAASAGESGDAAGSAGDDDDLPSSAQQAIWFLDKLHPGSNEYLLPLVLELRGRLDQDRLAGAIDELGARHEMLRTRYLNVDGEPRAVTDRPGHVEMARSDLTSLRAADRDATVARVLDAELNAPIDLSKEHPFRVRLLGLAPDHNILAITCHHIAVDGHSLTIIRQELASLYSGMARQAPSARYADFVRHERSLLESPERESLIAYWRRTLNDARPLDLPADRRRPALRDTAGDRLRFALAPPDCRQVHALARGCQSTPFMVLLAGFAGFLVAVTGQRDIVIGTSASGRDTLAMQEVIGLLVSTLPLRLTMPANPVFSELLERVRDSVRGAYAHRELPFDVLVRELKPRRDSSRTPFIDVMFVFAQDTDPGITMGGLEVTQLAIDSRASGFDLTLQVEERQDGSFTCEFEYATSLFEAQSIQRLADDFTQFLGASMRNEAGS